MKRYLIYAHHIIYLLLAAPIWIYGRLQYSGPSNLGGNGNSGPLAYSPLLTILFDLLLAYLLVSIVMVSVCVYRLAKRRRNSLPALVLNLCLPLLVLFCSLAMYFWLEEA